MRSSADKLNAKVNFSAFRKTMSSIVRRWSDERDDKKRKYEIHDVVMSAFACMFFQSPSLLQFQRDMKQQDGNSNLQTQFGVTNCPSNTQLREVLDSIPSRKFESLFNAFIEKLNKANLLSAFETPLDSYFLSVDGTQYYCSDNIRCPKCLVKKRGDNKQYSHQMLQSAIVRPGLKSVVPLMPVEISNDSAHEYDKQDCERKALRRLFPLLKRSSLNKKLTFLLDALYADQFVVQDLRQSEYDFIIVSKPNDNKYLQETFWQITVKKEKKIVQDKKYQHEYQWHNAMPLTADKKTIVGFLDYKMKRYNRKTNSYDDVVYKNSWITSHLITADNADYLALGGRARWKIENECFNNLKNHGYHLEHSYGHGEKHLSFNFIILTLLAFFIHQMLERHNDLFQFCQKTVSRKARLWEKLNVLIELFIFDSFESLLMTILNPEQFIDKSMLIKKIRDGTFTTAI